MAQQRFYSSGVEMNRRAGAFTALACCWIAELALAGVLLPLTYRQAVVQFTWLLGVALAMLWVYTMYYLYYQHAHTFIQTSGALLTKVGRFTARSIDLGHLKRVSVKYTTRGSIRRITLVLQTGGRLYIDGMQDFDALAAKILKANPAIKATKIQEKIDFDHVLFYPCLSLVFTAIVLLSIVIGVNFI